MLSQSESMTMAPFSSGRLGNRELEPTGERVYGAWGSLSSSLRNAQLFHLRPAPEPVGESLSAVRVHYKLAGGPDRKLRDGRSTRQLAGFPFLWSCALICARCRLCLRLVN